MKKAVTLYMYKLLSHDRKPNTFTQMYKAAFQQIYRVKSFTSLQAQSDVEVDRHLGRGRS